MAQARLAAQLRQDKGKSATRKMRAAGRVPAVVYGHGDETRMLRWTLTSWTCCSSGCTTRTPSSS
jgi:ribosomal protein L25 (general stress protein Ctc)